MSDGACARVRQYVIKAIEEGADVPKLLLLINNPIGRYIKIHELIKKYALVIVAIKNSRVVAYVSTKVRHEIEKQCNKEVITLCRMDSEPDICDKILDKLKHLHPITV